MTLEQQLEKSAESWLSEEAPNPAQMAELRARIQRRIWRRRMMRSGIGLAAAVAVTALTIGLSPGLQAWAARNLPMVGKYIARWSQIEKGWEWAERNQMFQEVLAEASDNGYTLRVHRVLADPTQTTLVYTVEGANPAHINLEPGSLQFDGKRFSSGMGGRGEVIDGVMVGSIEFDPVPAESGELRLTVRRIGKVTGRWDLAFQVNRAPLTAATRTVEVNRTLEIPGGTLTIERLQIVPTQTVVEIRYLGQDQSPHLSESALLLPDGRELKRRGGGASGERAAGGAWQQTYTLEFERLDPVPSSLTLRLAGRVHGKQETRIDLTKSAGGQTPDGREVTVESVRQDGRDGSAIISMTVDARSPLPFDVMNWRVVDDQGRVHQAMPKLSSSSSGQMVPTSKATPMVHRAEITWSLPAGRTPAALVNLGFWEAVGDLGEVTIQIPAP